MTAFPDLSSQRELVDSFTRPAESLLPLSRLQHGAAADADQWRAMAELGWLGVSLPESDGGIGLSAVEEALAAIALGRFLPPPGFAATIVALHALSAAGEAELAQSGMAGERRAAFAATNGDATIAIDAPGADWLVIADDDAIEIVAAAGEAVVPNEAPRWGRPVEAVARGASVARATDPGLLALARVVIAAQLAGIASGAAERGVDYAQVREQFGRPIGAFQAVKHRCADMAIAAHAARELATYAAVALAESRDDAPALADAALNFAIRAARGNAGTNIQVHGGMGFSAECEAHHFLKAAHLLETAAGGLGATRRRLAPGKTG